MFSQFTHTCYHISALKNFPLCIFSQDFPPKKCAAKLVTVTNQPVARPSPTPILKKNIFSTQLVESIDGCRSG